MEKKKAMPFYVRHEGSTSRQPQKTPAVMWVGETSEKVRKSKVLGSAILGLSHYWERGKGVGEGDSYTLLSQD